MDITTDCGPTTADGIGADAEPGDLYGPPYDQVHQKPGDDAVCWLLDVRKYGLDAANEMHP